MAGRGTNTAVMESRKRKHIGRGRGLVESIDVRIGHEIAGKVGNSKRENWFYSIERIVFSENTIERSGTREIPPKESSVTEN